MYKTQKRACAKDRPAKTTSEHCIFPSKHCEFLYQKALESACAWRQCHKILLLYTSMILRQYSFCPCLPWTPSASDVLSGDWYRYSAKKSCIFESYLARICEDLAQQLRLLFLDACGQRGRASHGPYPFIADSRDKRTRKAQNLAQALRLKAI